MDSNERTLTLLGPITRFTNYSSFFRTILNNVCSICKLHFHIYLPEEIGIAKVDEIKRAIKNNDTFMAFEVYPFEVLRSQ